MSVGMIFRRPYYGPILENLEKDLVSVIVNLRLQDCFSFELSNLAIFHRKTT